MEHRPLRTGDPFWGGTLVHTSRSLRRLGKDIPRGTVGTVLGTGTYYGVREIRVLTDLGSFVVNPGEVGRDDQGRPIDAV